MSEEKTISPTVCGITVGKTTKSEIIANEDIITHEGKLTLISADENSVIYLGDFIVEDFHMSLMVLQFQNDTLYEIKIFDQNLQSKDWQCYKDFADHMRDKYSVSSQNQTELEDIKDVYIEYNENSKFFMKTDGSTNLSFSANIKRAVYTLSNQRMKIKMYKYYFLDNDPKNKVTAVAGVDFGLQRTNVEELFKCRGRFLKSEGSLTYFSNVDFAGRNYSHAILYFQYDETKNTQVFAAVQFEKNFYQWQKEEAEMMYKNICNSFNSKYTNGMIARDEAENKMMAFGMIEDNYQEGKVPPIIVSLDFDLSRGGDKYYYVTVSYFEGRMAHVTSDDL